MNQKPKSFIYRTAFDCNKLSKNHIKILLSPKLFQFPMTYLKSIHSSIHKVFNSIGMYEMNCKVMMYHINMSTFYMSHEGRFISDSVK